MVRDADDNDDYTRIDDTETGVHYTEGFVDSFYRTILLPTSIFPDFMELLHKSFNKTGPLKGMIFCTDKPGYGNCWVQNTTCSAVKNDFRDILIEFSDSRAYLISPDSYLEDSVDKSVNYCNILIQRNNIVNYTNEYVLGTIFMFNYYLVYDFDNQRIGFNGPTVNFSDDRSPPGFPLWAIIAIIVGIAIIAGAVFFFIRMRNKRLENELQGRG